MEGHHKTELEKKNQKKIQKKKKKCLIYNSSGRAAGISGTVVNPVKTLTESPVIQY